MGSMSTIVNHTVLNSWSFLRQCLKCSYQTQKKREQKGKKRNVKKERKWLLCEVMVMLIIWLKWSLYIAYIYDNIKPYT